MEIETEDLPETLNIDESVFDWKLKTQELIDQENYDPNYYLVKHKLLDSPIVQRIFSLNYATNKKLEGLESEISEDDGSFLTAKMRRALKVHMNQDSFDMDDDFDELEREMVRYTSDKQFEAPVPTAPVIPDKPEDLLEYKPELKNITISLTWTGLLVDGGMEHKFPGKIRCAEVIPGGKLSSEATDEDSLVVTLEVGFILLIRFFSVNNTIKPYIVQWWKTAFDPRSTELAPTQVGADILTHRDGLALGFAAKEGTIRLYQCLKTTKGIQLGGLQNLVFEGELLHSCFLDPLENAYENYSLIFTLILTPHRRYVIRVFEWLLDETEIRDRCTLYLTNDFQEPDSIVPFNQGVLFISRDYMMFLTINQLLSADLNFAVAEHKLSICSTYKPNTSIRFETEEVLVGTYDGMICDITIAEGNIKIEPVIKTTQVLSFVLERDEEHGFHLFYSNEISDTKHEFFETLIHRTDFDPSESPVRFKRTSSEVVSRHFSWPQTTDVAIVKNKTDLSEELWLANKNKLSNIKLGLKAVKEVYDNKLRKAYKVFFHVTSEDEVYFIFSHVEKTLIYKYEEDDLIDAQDTGLDLFSRTLIIDSIDDVCFQVTENSIIVANFVTGDRLTLDENIEFILSADVMAGFIAVVNEIGTGENFLLLYKVSGEIALFGEPLSLKVAPNFVKFVVYEGELYLTLVFEEHIELFKPEENAFFKMQSLVLPIKEPNDLVCIDNYLIIGSRTGELCKLKINNFKNYFTLTTVCALSLSESPIELNISDTEILIISKKLWVLPINDTKYPQPVVFDEMKQRCVFCAIPLEDSKYALLRDDGFCIASLSRDIQPIVKSIKLHSTPIQMKYLSHLGVFAILDRDGVISFANSTTKLDCRVYQRGSRKLFKDDIPLSISEWVYKNHENRIFRNLLVGCKRIRGFDEPKATEGFRGSLKILQIKPSPDLKDSIDVTEILTVNLDREVSCFVQVTNDVFVYCSNNLFVYSASYLPEEKKLSPPKLINEFSSFVVDISVDTEKSMIVISTKENFLSTMKYENGNFVTLESNKIPIRMGNSLLFKDSLIVTTDGNFRDGSVIGLKEGEEKFKLHTTFEPKIAKCSFSPLWYKSSLTRILAFGFLGELELYTLVDSKTAAELCEFKLGQRQSSIDFKTVAGKGLWELNAPDFTFPPREDVNVIDAADLDLDRLPEHLLDMVKAVAF